MLNKQKERFYTPEEAEDRRLWAEGQRKARADVERNCPPDVRRTAREIVDFLVPVRYGE